MLGRRALRVINFKASILWHDSELDSDFVNDLHVTSSAEIFLATTYSTQNHHDQAVTVNATVCPFLALKFIFDLPYMFLLTNALQQHIPICLFRFSNCSFANC